MLNVKLLNRLFAVHDLRFISRKVGCNSMKPSNLKEGLNI